MDIKKFLSSMLIAVAIMLAVMWYFKSGGETPPHTNPIYGAVPVNPLPDAHEAGASPRTVVLGGWSGSNDSLVALTINNITAGIDKVELNPKYYAESYDHSTPLTLFAADAKLGKPFSTIGVHIRIDNDPAEMPIGAGRIFYKTKDGVAQAVMASATDSPVDIAEANNTNLLSMGFVWKFDDARTTSTDAYLYASFGYQNEAPIARITKHFHLDPKSYEITVSHTVENLTNPPVPIHVQIDQLGSPALARDDPRSDDRFFHAVALNSTKKIVDGGNGYNMIWGGLRKAIAARKTSVGTEPIGQMYDVSSNPQLWVATSNRFFAVIIRPESEVAGHAATADDVTKKLAARPGEFIADGAGATFTLEGGKVIDEPTHVGTANIDLMALGGTPPASDKPADDVAMIRFSGHMIDVPAGKAVDEPIAVFLGPKKRDLLNGIPEAGGKPEYAIYQYIKLIQFNSCVVYSFCGIETIGMVILQVLDWLRVHVAFGNYGVAIMILVIAVRAMLHPLTRASQINMAKMSKQMRDVQPQLEAMKKRYADNKRKQSEEMMRIYRENNINPAGGIMGCLPMLLQAPIWVALYSGLSGDVDLRHSAFIPGWINDLASPDKILPHGALVLGHPVFTLPLLGDVYGLNLLPLMVAAVFFFQMKITAATQPKAADEQQAQVQKMSQYMIFLFPIMLYNAPSGLNLYIFASTLAGIVDTYFVRKTLRKRGILAASTPLLPTHEVPPEKPE